jgi:ABC-2 type transport system permease protein
VTATRAHGAALSMGEYAGRMLRTVTESARLQILVVRSSPMVPLTTVVQPAVFLAIFLSGGEPSAAGGRGPTVIAVLLTCMWGATLWAAGGTLRLEVADGTLARNLTGVSDPRLVVGGKCLGTTGLVLGLLLCTTGAAVVITRIPFQLRGAPWFVLGFVLVALSGTAMGFMLCSVFVLTRHAAHVTAALMYPVFILSGLLIPTSLLPGLLSWPSRLINLYWADRFLDKAAGGAFGLEPFLALLALTVLYLWAGCALFARVLDRARRLGTIDLG